MVCVVNKKAGLPVIIFWQSLPVWWRRLNPVDIQDKLKAENDELPEKLGIPYLRIETLKDVRPGSPGDPGLMTGRLDEAKAVPIEQQEPKSR
jgi:hypothetical protein